MGNRNNYPMWVKLGLWGLSTRASALALLWSCMAIAIISLIGGFWNPLFLSGLIMLLAAWWYWAAIKWVDKNDRW